MLNNLVARFNDFGQGFNDGPLSIAIGAMEERMAARAASVKRYVVRLSAERRGLEAIIHKGKSSAAWLLKARILLKADVSEAGEGWSDSRIVEALETSVSMVYRVRRQLVEEGLEGGSEPQGGRPGLPCCGFSTARRSG